MVGDARQAGLPEKVTTRQMQVCGGRARQVQLLQRPWGEHGWRVQRRGSRATINNARLPILVLKLLHREFPWINSLMWSRQIKNPTRRLSLLHIEYGMPSIQN